MNNFTWLESLRNFGPKVRGELTRERGLQVSTFDKLVGQKMIGMTYAHNPRTKQSAWCVSFPVQNSNGEVVRAHCRWPEKNQKGKWDWFYHPFDPDEKPIGPLVFGNIQTATKAYLSESQWDLIALIEKLDLFDEVERGEVILVATRGAESGNRLLSLPWPEEIVIYAIPQNDEPGRKWLRDAIEKLNRPIYVIEVPNDCKDLNVWVQEGATGGLIDTAIEHACAQQAEADNQHNDNQQSDQHPKLFGEQLGEDYADQPKVGSGNKIQQTVSPDLERESQEAFERYTLEPTPFPGPMRQEAFYGLAGRTARIMAEHCEASLETLLVQCLVMIGNVIGRSAYVYAGGPYLFPNEYVVCVGNTSRGRKGTALKMNERLLELVAQEWLDDCTSSELQTGEGAVYRIRDERRGIPPNNRRNHKPVNELPVEQVLDPGVSDKRLLIIEEEFSHTLKMAHRSGNSLTELLRKGWDSPRILRTSNKNSPLQASDPHVSLIGHATREELLACLKEVDLTNGLANRILWIASERRTLMPNADFLDWTQYLDIAQELRAVLRQRSANTAEPYRFRRTPEAEKLWDAIYRKLNELNRLGFLDAVSVRDTSHILKLALLYAIIDRAPDIRGQHLEAALAVVDFSWESARWIFGQSTWNKLANNILWELRHRPQGLTRDAISVEVCFRNTPKTQIDQALEILARNRLAKMQLEIAKNNKRVERWFLC